MTRFATPLAALLLAAPTLSQAQADDTMTAQDAVCCTETSHHDVTEEDRLRTLAETRMLNSETRRKQAEIRMLNAQRDVIREEQRRIKAHSQAMLSAAKQKEWEHRLADVRIDRLTPEMHRHHTVVLTSVTGVGTKESVQHISEALAGNTALQFVNPLKIKRKYRTHRKLPLGFEQRPGVLRMQLHREPLNEFGRFVRLTLVDHTGAVVYEAHYENMHYGEMLAPLQGVSIL